MIPHMSAEIKRISVRFPNTQLPKIQ